MMKFTATLALAAVACLAATVAEARPRDGKIVVRPDRVTVRAPRGSVLVPVPPVVPAPGAAPVPAVAVVPRRLTARQLALLAAVPPPVIPIPKPGLLAPAVPVAYPVVVPEPGPVVVPEPAVPPVFSALPPATRASVVASRPPAAMVRQPAVVARPTIAAPNRLTPPLPVRPVAPAATPVPAADGTQSVLVSGAEPAPSQPADPQSAPADPTSEFLPTP